MNRAKRLSTTAVWLVVAMAVVIAALFGLGLTPYKLYVIHTGSMSPTIPSKSAVIVHKDDYHLGQVIVFRTNDGSVITHRLIAIGPDDTITTKGDADRSVDPWHPPKRNIIGGVILAPRGLGWMLYYLFRTTGGLSLVLFIICIWLAWSVANTYCPQHKQPHDAT